VKTGFRMLLLKWKSFLITTGILSGIYSQTRLKVLAAALQQRAEELDIVVNALVQVNVSGENSKFGLSPAKLPAFLLKLYSYDRIKVKGLMTMAPFVDDPEEARPHFRHLRQLRDNNARPGMELEELSMGMTNDYEVAVEEGATMVRIGSALFS